MFTNIHTHKSPANKEWSIENLYADFDKKIIGGRYSIGLHPWYIDKNTLDDKLMQLKNWAKHASVVAIGECGLDKICATDFALQQKAFLAQIHLANKINKPLVIHCVRAYDEVIELLDRDKNRVPVIFHGFNKNQQLALRLIEKGYYLSFGQAVRQASMQQLIATLPLDRIFFETDDADIDIEELYTIAAEALQIDSFLLSLQIQKNVATIFGNDLF